MLTTLIVSLTITITEFVRRFIGPPPQPPKEIAELELASAPAPLLQPAPHPNSPSGGPAQEQSKDQSQELQLKLAHRRGAMAEYTRPKYEVREW